MANWSDRLAKLAQMLDVDGNPPGGSGGSENPLDSYLAASGSARNDEFDDGPGIDGKWTLVGTTPDDVDENNDYAGMLLLRRNDTASQLTVYHQSVPTAPFTIVMKSRAANHQANYCRGGGIILLPSSPTTSSNGRYVGHVYQDGKRVSCISYTPISGSYGGEAGATVIGAVPGGVWLRVDVLSGGTTIDAYYSVDGLLWGQMVSALALGFTVGAAGIALAPESQGVDLMSIFDFYRVSA